MLLFGAVGLAGSTKASLSLSAANRQEAEQILNALKKEHALADTSGFNPYIGRQAFDDKGIAAFHWDSTFNGNVIKGHEQTLAQANNLGLSEAARKEALKHATTPHLQMKFDALDIRIFFPRE